MLICEPFVPVQVILMSASLNSEAFSRYFGGCPQYHVSGRCFPVEIRYLPQIESDMRRTAKQTNKSSSDQRRVDYDLVVDLIRYINTTESSNTDSILCFLPGRFRAARNLEIKKFEF